MLNDFYEIYSQSHMKLIDIFDRIAKAIKHYLMELRAEIDEIIMKMKNESAEILKKLQEKLAKLIKELEDCELLFFIIKRSCK